MCQDSQTTVLASIQQARSFANKLIRAADKAERTGEVQHIRGLFEQSGSEGPWRIRVHVWFGDDGSEGEQKNGPEEVTS